MHLLGLRGLVKLDVNVFAGVSAHPGSSHELLGLECNLCRPDDGLVKVG